MQAQAIGEPALCLFLCFLASAQMVYKCAASLREFRIKYDVF